MSAASLYLDLANAVSAFPPASKTSAVVDYATLFELVTPNASNSERERFLEYVKEKKQSALGGLEKAVEIVAGRVSGFDFFGVTLPHLCETVRNIPLIFNGDAKVKILRKGEPGKLTLSRVQAMHSWPQVFFQSIPEIDDGSGRRDSTFGNISWTKLQFESRAVVGVHRLACLLTYFHMVAVQASTQPSAPTSEAAVSSLRGAIEELTAKDDPFIVFERVCRGDLIPSFGDLERMTEVPVIATFDQPALIVTSTTRIEDVASADAIVDFANKQVQIGCIIASATQEEIMFSIIPEAMIAVLVFEELNDDEAGLIHGARRFCNYTGYYHSFRYDGPCALHDDTAGQPPTIVIIDALENRGNLQFEDDPFKRDVAKALMGFLGVRKVRRSPHSSAEESLVPVVATGGWGCGIFCGDQTLKFLQQLIAASLAKCKLIYCTFGSQEREHSFKMIAHRLQSRNITVATVAAWVREYMAEVTDESDFELFVLSKLK
ncbi:poly (ADP-ribose) glycohydrolase, putative [Bodo saltans]|uniref:poly(ADP-ribose) glycohydrolase n=1 Tax=Bodo saltans TaxID=75058 RepID=A0A0S4JBU3_BODSA|nr:poly (ADP-ribose) glycohydrolase, putative [Bodo saltans]|eukprot:CUG85448.1 poly (ADP-ribose) glycohydrolase, putative [Bodo saltans]